MIQNHKEIFLKPSTFRNNTNIGNTPSSINESGHSKRKNNIFYQNNYGSENMNVLNNDLKNSKNKMKKK